MKNNFAKNLKQLMSEEKMTQMQLALAIKTAQSTVCSWLQGQKEPGLENLWKIADIFNVSIDELVGRNDY